MTQNIYDDPEFFTAYGGLPRSRAGLDAAPEWPTLRGMLPPLEGRRVVDLGCGYGWFCRWAREEGAARLLGVDVSQRMLARARAMTPDPAILYVRADLETFELRRHTVDLIYSSLTLHYLADLGHLFEAVAEALVPGGDLVFSAEHPVFTAPAEPGWVLDRNGRKTWPIEGYANEGQRRVMWLGKPVVKQHRTVATYLNLLLRTGFALQQLVEWAPTRDQVRERPALADELDRPPFLLVAARKQ
jgi:SAM-dependent methyltransferase